MALILSENSRHWVGCDVWMTIDQTVYIDSKVQILDNWEGKPVVNMVFTTQNREYHLNIDRATAAKLINQLRKELDK